MQSAHGSAPASPSLLLAAVKVQGNVDLSQPSPARGAAQIIGQHEEELENGWSGGCNIIEIGGHFVLYGLHTVLEREHAASPNLDVALRNKE